MLGPLFIGSTESIDTLYMLRASLQILSEWIRTTYAAFLETWLSVEPGIINEED